MTDYAEITAFDIVGNVMIVSFQDRLQGSKGEDEVHIMSYDLSQKKTLWLFNKKDDKNITLSVKIRQQESLIIALALNKKILYIDLLSGNLRAEFDINYQYTEPFLIVYDIYGKAYIGLNGQLQIQETLVQNLRGYYGNYLQIRISTIDSSNHQIYYQSAFIPGQNSNPTILLYSLSAGSDYCVGLMAYEHFSNERIIGLSVLNITTVTRNSTARFFVKVQPTNDAVFFQYIVTVEDIKSPDKMIFQVLQDYPYKNTQFFSALNKTNKRFYMHGLVYQETGQYPQAFINEYQDDPFCNYQQPIGQS
ncbi:UNKNOWN [Stylonychia lemnae]|uniref:Uncharacterized protein n=1 Tax=Stylonychia lemnae TaxID=5949 RepID=A0A078AS27_STYLE|nr:UNKNOWN [Stylonychia lemnae]|eukprot:CDW83688.1 UNKNOWN [Stylonychia lemnae]